MNRWYNTEASTANFVSIPNSPTLPATPVKNSQLEPKRIVPKVLISNYQKIQNIHQEEIQLTRETQIENDIKVQNQTINKKVFESFSSFALNTSNLGDNEIYLNQTVESIIDSQNPSVFMSDSSSLMRKSDSTNTHTCDTTKDTTMI